MNQPTLARCPITGSDATDSSIFNGEYKYSVIIKNYNEEFGATTKQTILLPINYTDWIGDAVFYNNRYILAGLLLNGKLFEFSEEYCHRLSLNDLKSKLSSCNYPKTTQEKYENLFLSLFKLQDYDGQTLYYSNKLNDKDMYKKLYFKNEGELTFYTKSLHEDGLIEGDFMKTTSAIGSELLIRSIQITYKGLSYAIRLMDEGIQSKNCFIAMSFGNDMGEVRNAIKKACIKTGFTPILVDEVHYDSDTNINDAIIANLRKSRFCIADFTEQKDGVYFESGFALGEGKQVIYTCQEDWFKKSHFDTNHFPHIVYKTAEELTNALVNKIEAWIR